MTDSDDVRRVMGMAAVYRMYDERGELLYVGSSGSMASRLADHADRRWYPLVATIRLEWFPDRDAASAAEVKAILNEHPQINIVGVPKALRRPRPRVPAEALRHRQVSLSEAVGMRVLRCTLDAARKRSGRDPAFPRPAGQRGLEFLYDVGELHAYQVSKEKR